uniref:Ubs_30 putative toxin n=1 Tax=Unedogemmula bisaya TaxID=746885 RepID=A0A098LWI2_UNEBI
MRSMRLVLVATMVTIVVIVMALADRYTTRQDKPPVAARDISHLQGTANRPQPGGPSSNAVDKCHQPPFTGMCRAYFPKYYYNATLKKCIEFIYGGCNGNDNRFNTVEECMTECHHPLD